MLDGPSVCCKYRMTKSIFWASLQNGGSGTNMVLNGPAGLFCKYRMIIECIAGLPTGRRGTMVLGRLSSICLNFK
jgi:hypothetical protein